MSNLSAQMVGAIVIALAAMLIFGFLLAWPVVWIWNWMVPELFGLPLITYWQAYWLGVLLRLLFGTGVSVSK